MCTVTIVPRGGEAGGYRLVTNRDERCDRPGALRPVWHCRRKGRAAYPIDPVGGGTWVGVNDVGLTVALLNRYQRFDGRLNPQAPSRGLIIPALLGCQTATQAITLARSLDC